MTFDTDQVFSNSAEYAERGTRTGRSLQSELLRALLRAAIRKISSGVKRAADGIRIQVKSTRPAGRS
jgi:hypothetical protein